MSMYEEEAKRALSEWASSKYATLEGAKQSIQLSGRLRGELSDFFNATNLSRTKSVDPADYWTSDGLEDAYVFTRGVFRYPTLLARGQLPTMGAGVRADMSLATGESGYIAEHTRFLVEESEVEFEYGYVQYGGADIDMVIHDASWFPSDYDTADHTYKIVVKGNGAELWIDDVLRVVVVGGYDITGSTGHTKINQKNPPYAVGLYEAETITPDLTGVFMAHDGKLGVDITGDNLQVVSGDPFPPQRFPLYNWNTDTEWSGLSTGGSVQTSHPVPIWGYQNKTVYAQADAAGSLAIEIYAGGDWREYDSVTLTANELEHYTLPAEMQAPLMRCVYTPTDDDTIAYGEVHLA